jgi:hypothetical protein
VRLAFVLLAVLAGPTPPPAVAVQWREDPGDEELQRSLREAIAARDGRPASAIPDRALERARVVVSRELPAALRPLGAAARAKLDRADAAFREARFDDAQASVESALAELHAHPNLPGAAASAREAHLLAAKIAWARPDRPAAEHALGEALRLDPEAQLSVREAAPELVARYLELQAQLLAERETTWVQPTIEAADAEIVIDGARGLRRVPPGGHFIVVYRDGHEPIAAWHDVGQPWAVPDTGPRLPDDVDTTTAEVCDVLELDVLVLAERRESQIGLQALRCGEGFGPIWAGPRERLAEGVDTVLAGPFDTRSFALAGEWPAPIAIAVPPRRVDEPRPWFRRGWIWGTSAGVTAAIIGGVVAGVVLANRDPRAPMVDVDAGKFIGD